MALGDMNYKVAIARAVIYSGAALVRDFSFALRETEEVRRLLSGDISVTTNFIRDAHRAAVIGLFAMIFDERSLQDGTPIDLIFDASPRTMEDDEIIRSIPNKFSLGEHQETALARLVANRLGAIASEAQQRELSQLVRKRLNDLNELSNAKINRPYLDYLRREIL